jgi:hypothetical protein
LKILVQLISEQIPNYKIKRNFDTKFWLERDKWTRGNVEKYGEKWIWQKTQPWHQCYKCLKWRHIIGSYEDFNKVKNEWECSQILDANLSEQSK